MEDEETNTEETPRDPGTSEAPTGAPPTSDDERPADSEHDLEGESGDE